MPLKPRIFWTILLTISFLLPAGCAVGPDYDPPEIDPPGAWRNRDETGITGEEADPLALVRWWETLRDPMLSRLMTLAVRGNLDLREALARVREARARRGIAWSDLFPELAGSGKAGRSRTSENSPRGTGETRDLYTLGFDAGWEIDVFGGTRRATEAADADLEASIEDLRDVRVSLLAEVALNYIEARTFQTRLDVAGANLQAQEKTFEFTRSRFKAGLSNELAVQQARYNLASTRSRIPTLRTGLEAAKNRLAVLLGAPPGTVHERLAKRRPAPVVPPRVAVGVPAETLRRRPDVRRAERELAAQTARVGVAVAELYPKFRLTGSIGLESVSTGNLLDAASGAWGWGSGFSWRIFEFGAVRRAIDVQSARQEQALVRYEKTLLTALEEVENALTAYGQEQIRRQSLYTATDSAEQAVALSWDQYKAGLIDFTDVLDAQRSLLSLQDELALSTGAVTANLVRLYKALGGGWRFMAAETPGPAGRRDGSPGPAPDRTGNRPPG